MLKHNFAINLATAGLLVVPAVTLQSGTSASLGEALQQTVEALEVVAGIEQRVQDGNVQAVAEILRFTEAPTENPKTPGAADELLETLRGEVAQLQYRVDETQRDQAAPEFPSVETLLADEPRVALPAGTTGLDERMRRMLSTKPVRAIPAQPQVAPTAPAVEQKDEPAPVSVEAAGYTADPLRLGRALYQKGRYQDALNVLAQATSQLEGRYWRARSLEKLGRFGEALDEFSIVVSSEEGGHFVDRAREDIDFLRWRMAFQGKHKGDK